MTARDLRDIFDTPTVPPKYERLSPLGRGGMGEVWRALDTELEREVALKVMHVADPEARARLWQEAQLAAALDHPHIARVYEVWVGENGEPSIAMQLVDGETLATAAREMSLDQKLTAFDEVVDAINHAHEHGVVHRDLKPSNVLLDRAGRAVVTDFGLAKRLAPDPTTTDVISGSPSYMSPEQARGRSDAQSDVYGLGALLYELLTGRPPFLGDNALDVLRQVLSDDPIRPRRLVPRLARDLEAITLKALEKERARRYRNAAELAEDLGRFRADRPLRHARRPSLWRAGYKKLRRHPLVALLALGFVAALAGGIGMALSQAARERWIVELGGAWSDVAEKKRELFGARVPPADGRAALHAARDRLSALVAREPTEPDGWIMLSRASLYLGELDLAEADARRAVALGPELRSTHRALARVLIANSDAHIATGGGRRDLDAGVRALEAAVAELAKGTDEAPSLLPESRENQIERALTDAWTGKYRLDEGPVSAQIEKAYERYQAEEYALALSEMTRGEQAAHWATRAVELAPGWASAWTALANSHVEADPELALKEYARALEWAPNHYPALANGAAIYVWKGAWEEARTYLDRALALRTEPIQLVQRGWARCMLGDRVAGIADMDRAVSLAPLDPEIVAKRGGFRLVDGDRLGARVDLERALAVAPPDWSARAETQALLERAR